MTKAFYLVALGLFLVGAALAPVTAGVPDRWAKVDPGLQQAYERTVYAVHSVGSRWLSQNRAQELNVEFHGEGANLRTQDSAVTFQLAGYGYGEELRKPGPATVVADANRLEYRRAEVTEWYVNSENGLEQGFSFAKRPATDRGSSFTVALNLTGNLRPRMAGEAIVLDGRDGSVLRYSGLTAIDADGRTLPSRMEVQGNRIRLLVEDEKARYPLVIDPTWTSQTLQPSGAVEAGDSVAMAGSVAVVGDPGYSSYTGGAYIYTYSGSTWSL